MNRTHLWVLILGSLLSSKTVEAQEKNELKLPKNRLQLSVGYDHAYFKDYNLSPLNYKGPGYGIDFGYQGNTRKKHLWKVDFHHSSSTLKTPASTRFDVDRDVFRFQLGYTHSVPLKNTSSHLRVGAGYRTYIDFQDFLELNAISYFGLHAFELQADYTHQISQKHQIETSIGIPFYGLLARPPYSGWDKHMIENADNLVLNFFRGSWKSLNTFQAVNWSVDYRFQFAKHWELNVAYQLHHYRTSFRDKAVIASNQLQLGINFTF